MTTRIPIQQPINYALDHVAWQDVCKKAYVVGAARETRFNNFPRWDDTCMKLYEVGPQYGRVQPLSVIVSTCAREMDCH